MSRLILALISVVAGLALSTAYADDQSTPKIEANQTQWSQLSDEEKAQVEQALSQSFPGQRFAPAPASAPPSQRFRSRLLRNVSSSAKSAALWRARRAHCCRRSRQQSALPQRRSCRRSATALATRTNSRRGEQGLRSLRHTSRSCASSADLAGGEAVSCLQCRDFFG